MVRNLALVILAFCLAACAGDDTLALPIETERIPSPAGGESGEPFLSSFDGAVFMSWLEAAPTGGHDLRFSRLEGERWGEAETIANSDRFFVNWADFPSVTPGPQGQLWAHWLERGAEGGYDYGIRVVRSVDQGATWSDPWTPHEDATPTEHGFVSVLPTGDGDVGFAWLDGRKYAPGADGSAPSDEMTLRYRTLDSEGNPGPETLLDARVCDCCQTDAAMTASGPIVAYRDRSDGEIRDIYVTRLVGGVWAEGQPVHTDGWEIAGCPVNGPAIAASGDDVVVAWFTAAGDVPHVKVAHSSDGGASFGAPSVVDDGSPGGRVDVLRTSAGSILVSWLERTGGEAAEVRLREVFDDGRATASVSLTEASAARASGFPRMIEGSAGVVLLAWTDVGGDAPQVRVTKVTLGGAPGR